jgi:hypothetical protein
VVSSGSNTEYTEGTQLDLTWFQASKLYVQQYSDVHVRNVEWGLQWWKLKDIGRGSLGAIIEFVGILPRSL